MDDTPDPATQFFPGVAPEDIDLYASLKLSRDATASDIRQAYRKLALLYHPDKHVNSSPEAQEEAHAKFQQIGYSYAVLSDETKRARYDKTGRTDDGAGLEPGEGGWEAYFEELFDKVTRGKLDEMKKEYQGEPAVVCTVAVDPHSPLGSQEEIDDLKKAYVDHEGSIEGILSEIPHSNYEDEARFIAVLKPLIKSKELPKFAAWDHDIKDSARREKRKRAGQQEAKEAEEHAKAIGVWDEFYGSGKEGPRKKGKGKANVDDGDDGDVSALQALILKKKAARGSILDSIAAKYGATAEEEPPQRSKGKSKRRATHTEEEAEEEAEEVRPRKKAKASAMPSRPTTRKTSNKSR